MAQKILVTGGAGFIGSHVVEVLRADGLEVFVIDNLSTGKKENLPQDIILLESDITNPALPQTIAALGVDTIVHMAAQASVAVSTNQPLFDGTTNILGSINMLVAAKEAGVRRFIYTSSAAVYGDPQFLPITESHPIAPLSNYGISKYVPERYLEVYARQFGLSTCALRLANVYGPRQNAAGEAGVVAIFLNQILKGQTPTIDGDGEQSRDFIYVGDVAKAFSRAVKSEVTGALNIGTGLATTVNGLYAAMQESCHFTATAKYGMSRPGDIRHSILDNKRAMQTLAWKPEWSLREGIRETAKFYAG